MAHKRKGAALYELLYRDKGKAGENALKLPSWFHTKTPQPPAQIGQPAQPPPPATAAPLAAAWPAEPAAGKNPPDRAPQPSSAEKPAVSALPDVPPIPPRATPGPTPPKPSTHSFFGSVTPRTAPAGGSPSFSRPGPFSRPASWFNVGDGKIIMELSNRAALLTVCGGLCVLLLAFIMGLGIGKAVRPTASPDNRPAGVKDINEGVKMPPDPKIVLHPEKDTHSGGTTTAKPPVSPSENVTDPDIMVKGKSYVIVQGFKDRTQADTLAKLLKDKNYDITVRKQDAAGGEVYVVRTAKGLDKASATKLSEELATVVEEIAHQQPSLGIKITSDPRSKPWVKTPS